MIRLSATNLERGEYHRIVRLANTYSATLQQAMLRSREDTGLMVDSLLALHDHKGCLSALWTTCADSDVWMMDALRDAWGAQNEEMIIHVCLSCGVVRADGGADPNWAQFAEEVAEFLDDQILRAMPVMGSA